jgi:putative transposase
MPFSMWQRAGCQWTYLPKDFSPWKTVYTYFWTWQKQGLFEKLHDELRRLIRTLLGRHEEPSAELLIANLQRQRKGGIKGRKRFIVVGTQGFILNCHVPAANVSEKQGFIELFNQNSLPTVEKIWADWAYTGYELKVFAANIGKYLEMIKRSKEKKGFNMSPIRWIVERTFGWLGRYRRLSKDYEGLPETIKNWIYISMTRLMLKRIDL